MQSNVCKIEKGAQCLNAILKESERVSEYVGLTHKQSLQLRLLCEETDGMLPHIIDDFGGELWIEYAEGVCKVCISIVIPKLTANKKTELIGIAKNKKNSAAVGIVGKIRNSIENFFLDEDSMRAMDISLGSYYMTAGSCESTDYSYMWSLEQYRNSLKKEEQTEAWDELEKSVIASVADDVIVAIKGISANIIIVKKFA